MLKIQPISAFSDNYIWLIGNSEKALVVDPGDSKPVLDTLRHYNVQLCSILVTHHHADHVGGIPGLLEHYDVPVYGPAASKLPFIDHYLTEGDQITINELQHCFNVLAIPGHTMDHIAYFDTDYLFCGDTLFLGGCGRLFEGTPKQMLQSLDKLSQLNDNIKVYCAHEYTLQNLMFAQSIEPDNNTLQSRIEQIVAMRLSNRPTIPATLAVEKQTNPFLRVHDVTFKQYCEAKWQCQFADSIELFAHLRRAKDNFRFSEAAYLQKV